MAKPAPTTVNIDDAPEKEYLEGDHWGHAYKVLTPSMGRTGRLGVNVTRLPPGRAACPFHYHQLEDEVFFVLSGRGWLRYGDELSELRPSDCVSCPAGTGKAHQIANPFGEDLVYLAIGQNDPNEVCVYPDSNKVMVRSLKHVGFIDRVTYMAGESDSPSIFALIDQQQGPDRTS